MNSLSSDNPGKPMYSQRSWRKVFWVGFVVGVLAAVVSFVATQLAGLPYPPVAIFQLLINPVPGAVQSVAVDKLGEYAKYSALTFASIIFAAFYGVIAVGLRSLSRRGSGRWTIIGVGAAIPVVLTLVLQAKLVSSFSSLSSIGGWGLAAVLAVVINLGYSTYVTSALQVSTATPAQTRVGMEPGRRKLLKRVGFGVLGIAAVYFLSKIGLSLLSGQPIVQSNTPIPVNSQQTTTIAALTGAPNIFSDPRIAGLVASEVTDTRIFYRVDIDPFPPQIDFDQWTLSVYGRVLKQLSISKEDLVAMQTSSEYATLECVSNSVEPPGALISNAKWTGVPLATILKQAGLASDAVYLIFHCSEGYTVGIPIERALEPGALLAYMMNDAPLPPEHGYPLRAIIPGLYGMMNAKWITGIEASNSVYMGYWQERGWTNDARVNTTSIIYYPTYGAQVNQPTPIAGVAFAGDRGISKVEVSTDGGNTWNTTQLKPPKSPYSWVLWAYMWTPTTNGNQTIIARATDGTDQTQTSAATAPFPNGATGYNSIQVNVT